MIREIAVNCFILLIATFIIWMCVISIRYRNNQCSTQRRIYQSNRTTGSHSLDPSLIDPRLKLNHFTVLGTHNSYHQQNALYRYGHADLAEQFYYGVRQIELDLHLMPDHDVVYHVQLFDDRTNCYCLSDCIERIWNWTIANANHYPIYLFIEIKQMFYEDLFTGLQGGVKCKHFEALKQQLLDVFTNTSLILPPEVQGNQSSLRLALRKQKYYEQKGDFTYAGYGWPPLHLSLGKIIPAFLDDVHNIVPDMIDSCDPLSDFFFIVQQNTTKDYASFITTSSPINNQYLMQKSINRGYILRVLLGYGGTRLNENYNEAMAYGAHIFSTDSEACYDTDICQSVMNDFKSGSSILCNPVLSPDFCNVTSFVL